MNATLEIRAWIPVDIPDHLVPSGHAGWREREVLEPYLKSIAAESIRTGTGLRVHPRAVVGPLDDDDCGIFPHRVTLHLPEHCSPDTRGAAPLVEPPVP